LKAFGCQDFVILEVVFVEERDIDHVMDNLLHHIDSDVRPVMGLPDHDGEGILVLEFIEIGMPVADVDEEKVDGGALQAIPIEELYYLGVVVYPCIYRVEQKPVVALLPAHLVAVPFDEGLERIPEDPPLATDPERLQLLILDVAHHRHSAYA